MGHVLSVVTPLRANATHIIMEQIVVVSEVTLLLLDRMIGAHALSTATTIRANVTFTNME